MLCVEVDVKDARCVGCRLIALNEYMVVSAGIHIDVLGRAVFRLSEAVVLTVNC